MSPDHIQVLHCNPFYSCDSAFWKQQLRTLPEAIQQRILAYTREEDRILRIAGKYLLQQLLERYEPGLSLADLVYTDLAQPYFTDTAVSFSISHSGEQVVCALSTQTKLGIDIEQVRTVRIDLLSEYLDAAGRERVQHAADPDVAFIEEWTMREAVLKASGKGVCRMETLIVQPERVTIDTQAYYVQSLSVAAGYSCWLASEERLPVRIEPLL